MKDRLLFSSIFLFSLAIQLFSQVDSSGISWFDPREAPFELNGFAWMTEDGVYRRLPVNPAWEIREAVDNLANHTAGGQIRFHSDCKKLLIKVMLRGKSGMYHMPATGQSGFDLYLEEEGDQRYIRTARFSPDSSHYQDELFTETTRQMRTFTLNFPLYNGVDSVWIGLDQGSTLKKPPPFAQAGKVVIYGTSITQGGCVGRPGMAYSNLLSRKLDIQFVNLGFSGNGRGETALAHLITQIPETRCILLDYEANAGSDIKASLGPFVDILRDSYPDIPILIVSRIRFSHDREGSTRYEEWMQLKDFQRELVKQRKHAGDKHIYFLDGSTLLGEDYDECTVDGVHPNDLGSMRIADKLLPVIADMLDANPFSSR